MGVIGSMAGDDGRYMFMLWWKYNVMGTSDIAARQRIRISDLT